MSKFLAPFAFLLLFANFTFAQDTPVTDTANKPSGPPFDYARDFRSILEKTMDRGSMFSYDRLIIRFLDNDSSLTNAEVLALMIGFTEKPHFKPVTMMEKELEIMDLSKENKFRELVDVSRPFLQTVPLSMLALRETAIAYNRLRMKDSADYFASLHDKIMEAMIYSGKGKKPLEPIFSLGLADGEYFIPNIGFYVDRKNTEWNKRGHFMEVIDAFSPDDVKSTFYFVIDHAKQKMDDDQPDALDAKREKKAKKKDKEDKLKEEKRKKAAEKKG